MFLFALVVGFAVRKSLVMDPFVVVVCLVLYAILVVSWAFMCFCSGFLPNFVVPFSALEDLAAGRFPFFVSLALVL